MEKFEVEVERERERERERDLPTCWQRWEEADQTVARVWLREWQTKSA